MSSTRIVRAAQRVWPISSHNANCPTMQETTFTLQHNNNRRKYSSTMENFNVQGLFQQLGISSISCTSLLAPVWISRIIVKIPSFSYRWSLCVDDFKYAFKCVKGMALGYIMLNLVQKLFLHWTTIYHVINTKVGRANGHKVHYHFVKGIP